MAEEDQENEAQKQPEGESPLEKQISTPESTVALEKPQMSTGRRVWLWSAVVISVLVLLLTVGGIIGTWVVRGAAIDVVNGLMAGVDQLAGAGREGAALVGNRVGQLSDTVGEVQSAVDEISDNVSDRGLVLTLLPPEKEEELVNRANRVVDTANSILAAIEAAIDLYTTVNNIPFVNLPQPDPERVQEIENDIQVIQDDVAQLAADIQQFRDDVAARIGRVSTAAGEINAVLDQTQQALVELDNNLANIQTRAQNFADRFATMATIFAVVVTLLLAWIIYALANTAYGHWQELQA